MTSRAQSTWSPVSGVRPHSASPVASWAWVFVAVSVICGAATFVVGFQSVIAILTLFGFAAGLFGLARPVVGLFGIAILCVLDPMSRVYLMTGALPWNSFNYLLSLAALLSAPSLLTIRNVQIRLLHAFLVLLTVGLTADPRSHPRVPGCPENRRTARALLLLRSGECPGRNLVLAGGS